MIKKDKINIFWFRRDLRLYDNHGLLKALQKGNVLPIFIFDTDIIDKLEEKDDSRINFIHEQLIKLNDHLRSAGSTIKTFYNKPINVFETLYDQYFIQGVYYNTDYEPYATTRDQEIKDYLLKRGVNAFSFKDQVIFEKSEIVKNNGEPYTIFTPYSKKWKNLLSQVLLKPFNSQDHLKQFYKTDYTPVIKLDLIGFQNKNYNFPNRKINRDVIINYNQTRDFPALNGTSRLSVHLRFGTVSVREVIKETYMQNETFLNEMIWREFYMMILWHFPHVTYRSFKKKYDFLQWSNNEQEFEAWCNGQTGYPIVDAGIRELNKTGFMHNRLRMITASFLTKHLLIDWRWGEAYFAKKLLDYELSSNNGGWQWAASTGCDAVPYFRIFNPELQTKKFDQNYEYIKKWVPELNTKNYPTSIVDHNFARNRALSAYKTIQEI